MEPITTAIIAALAAGVTAGATQVSKSALVDAYNGVKTLIQNKFGKQSKLAKAVDELEENPESKGRQLTLQEEVHVAGAGQDPEVLQAAKVLATAVQRYVKQQGATGVDLKEIEAASLEIDKIIASGTGVKVEKGKFKEGIKISDVQAGQPDPNA
jgi:hypothetical protein